MSGTAWSWPLSTQRFHPHLLHAFEHFFFCSDMTPSQNQHYQSEPNLYLSMYMSPAEQCGRTVVSGRGVLLTHTSSEFTTPIEMRQNATYILSPGVQNKEKKKNRWWNFFKSRSKKLHAVFSGTKSIGLHFSNRECDLEVFDELSFIHSHEFLEKTFEACKSQQEL